MMSNRGSQTDFRESSTQTAGDPTSLGMSCYPRSIARLLGEAEDHQLWDASITQKLSFGVPLEQFDFCFEPSSFFNKTKWVCHEVNQGTLSDTLLNHEVGRSWIDNGTDASCKRRHKLNLADWSMKCYNPAESRSCDALLRRYSERASVYYFKQFSQIHYPVFLGTPVPKTSLNCRRMVELSETALNRKLHQLKASCLGNQDFDRSLRQFDLDEGPCKCRRKERVQQPKKHPKASSLFSGSVDPAAVDDMVDEESVLLVMGSLSGSPGIIRCEPTVKQQINFLVRWFAGWSEMQKSDFVPALVKKTSSCGINGIVDLLADTNLKETRPTLFSCQMKLFDEWCDAWTDDEKQEFISRIQEIDGAFFDKYQRTLSGEEDRVAAEMEREFMSILASAHVERESSSDVVTPETVLSDIVTAEQFVGQHATLVYVEDDKSSDLSPAEETGSTEQLTTPNSDKEPDVPAEDCDDAGGV
ncbi:unnamed protein product [Notodromas monacha]|uniref:Uncharacterized protein n=1 Tax=Notodromas monacha TaxID=399045 RepID=A0A7R9BLQ0_9CRUS|nr:unnamed protein product [Notodromas monacha]CAG0916453.1 unnamed protein product [Notodromas monacha]